MTTECVQVQTTVGARGDAERLAETLVERRLAACVQVIGPIHSSYRWQGKLESESEWLCVIKTHRACYDDVEAALSELHPYEMPEILAMPIVAGSAAYLKWIAGEVSSPSS